MNKEKKQIYGVDITDVAKEIIVEYKSQLEQKIRNIKRTDLDKRGIHVKLTEREIKLLKQFLIEKLLGGE